MTAPVAIGILVASLAAVAPAVPSRQVFAATQDLAAIHAWTQNIDAYMVIRDHAARTAPPPRLPTSAAELLRAEAAFAAEIRVRRHGAGIGDVFTPDIQRTFRGLIARTMSDHEIAVADLLHEFLSAVLPGGSRLAVNQRFPWHLGTAIPGCLLEVLPSLPKALQYRLIGRDLLLIDIDANLVVDVLPEAVPRPAEGLVAAAAK